METKIDVSEVKSFRTCKRQWQLSSRNRYHLTPHYTAPALHLGTIFHEALAQLYLGADFDKVMRLVKADMGSDALPLLSMIPKYYENVLLPDLDNDHWRVLEVEHKFEFPSPIEGVTCTGAIDLIVYEPETNLILGIEHKTCRDFRNRDLIYMDEQPRLYYEALERYIEEHNKEIDKENRDWSFKPGGMELRDHAANGGIIVSETKKLLRDFQYRRTVCKYSDEDREGFWGKWTNDLLEAYTRIRENKPEPPEPSYWACQMCDYRSVCANIGYQALPPSSTLVAEFSHEFKVREKDHLEEKLDWSERVL